MMNVGIKQEGTVSSERSRLVLRHREKLGTERNTGVGGAERQEEHQDQRKAYEKMGR